MITTIILSILVSLVSLIVNRLPIIDLPLIFISGVTVLVGYMNLFTFLFPINHLFIVLSLGLSGQVVILIWHFGWKIIHLLRGY